MSEILVSCYQPQHRSGLTYKVNIIQNTFLLSESLQSIVQFIDWINIENHYCFSYLLWRELTHVWPRLYHYKANIHSHSVWIVLFFDRTNILSYLIFCLCFYIIDILLVPELKKQMKKLRPKLEICSRTLYSVYVINYLRHLPGIRANGCESIVAYLTHTQWGSNSLPSLYYHRQSHEEVCPYGPWVSDQCFAHIWIELLIFQLTYFAL